MIRSLALCLLLATIPAAADPGSAAPSPWVRAGLVVDDPGGSADDATPDPAKSCDHVSFSRNLKYGESDLNVLDVATLDVPNAAPRPVLLFVAGESFTGDDAADGTDALQDQAMCSVARHGMVGVSVRYRLAPASPWPAGARDVAAAASWVRQNIDLFGGSRDEIMAFGYGVGAFHVASLLAHPEFQVRDADIAGAVLVSGIYRAGADAGAAEQAYLGADVSKYDERSAFPGILSIDTPLLLAWSALDPPRLVTQGEQLKQLLCNSIAHCPRTMILGKHEGLASLLGLDGSGEGLAGPMMELVREIEARGMP